MEGGGNDEGAWLLDGVDEGCCSSLAMRAAALGISPSPTIQINDNEQYMFLFLTCTSHLGVHVYVLDMHVWICVFVV